jgi:dolichyldiphosphatase
MSVSANLLGMFFVVLHTCLFVLVLFAPWNRGSRDAARVICLRAVSSLAVIVASFVSLALVTEDFSIRILSRAYHWLEPCHRWQVWFFDNSGFLLLLIVERFETWRSKAHAIYADEYAAPAGPKMHFKAVGNWRCAKLSPWSWIRSVLVAPVLEEFLFRCAFDAALRAASIPEPLSIALNGLLFSMAHCHHFIRHKCRTLLGRQLTITFFFGCLQAWNLRRADYSIWNCIMTHMVLNAVELTNIFGRPHANDGGGAETGSRLAILARVAALMVFILRYALDLAETMSPFRAELKALVNGEPLQLVPFQMVGHTVPFSLFLIEYHRDDPLVGRLMALCSMLPQMLFVAQLTAIYFLRTPEALALALGQLFNEMLSYLLKRIFREPRPPVVRLEIDAFGWPSSHAQFMAFLLIFCSFYAYCSRRMDASQRNGESLAKGGSIRRNILETGEELLVLLIVVALLSVLVAASRVYLGYHDARQVWHGIGVGALFGYIWFAVTERFLTSAIRRIRFLTTLGFNVN